MTLSRRQNHTPRPARGSVHSETARSLFPGRYVIALLHEIRRKGCAALLERIAPAWLWDATSVGHHRTPSRTFRPNLYGGLESRMLLTNWHVIPKVLGNAAFLLKHPSARAAFLKNFPPQVQNQSLTHKVGPITRKRFVIATQTARGGQAVEVTALDGSHYMIRLSYTSNTIATETAEGAVGQTGSTSPTAL